jgi:nucleoside-diphosphate-sugar epimerase
LKILILGVNGFIGNALVRRILNTTNWEVFGMDLYNNKLEHSLTHPRFHFLEGEAEGTGETLVQQFGFLDGETLGLI